MKSVAGRSKLLGKFANKEFSTGFSGIPFMEKAFPTHNSQLAPQVLFPFSLPYKETQKERASKCASLRFYSIVSTLVTPGVYICRTQ